MGRCDSLNIARGEEDGSCRGGGGEVGGGRLWKYLEAQFRGNSPPERIQSTFTPTRARICISFKEPRNRFLAGGIDSLAPERFTNTGSDYRLT